MQELGFEPRKTLSHRLLRPAHLTTLALLHKKLNIYSYKKLYKHDVLGIFEDGHNSLETPVPIPNTEVKPAMSLALVSERM